MDYALKLFLSLCLIWGYALAAWSGWQAVRRVDDEMSVDGRVVLAAIKEILICANTFRVKPDVTIRVGIYFIAPYLSASAATLMVMDRFGKTVSGEWLYYEQGFYMMTIIHALFIIATISYHLTTILMAGTKNAGQSI